jgi:nicotinamide-nucleotide amidase
VPSLSWLFAAGERGYRSGMRGEVIAIGDELTSGQRLDTNSRWLSSELGVLGIPVVFHTTAADTLAAGIEAFRVARARSDIVVATGGLGPTADDLTRDVLAAVAGAPLEFSAEAFTAVESRFARRGMPMPESNRRQALFPRGSRIIPNPHGTAPGIDVELPRDGGGCCRVFALPGVPAEMHVMWRDTVAPALVALLPDVATIVQKTLKCFGAGESAIEAMLPDLVRRGREPTVGITAHEATITLRIAARGRSEADCHRQIAETESVIRACLGDLVFGVGDEELEDAALRTAVQAVATVASIEIGTDGRVAALLAQAEARRGGCAPVYVGGTVEPLNAAADPAAVAALAADARSRFRASCGLAIGRRRPGPEGRDSIDIALATEVGTTLVEHVVGGGPLLAGSRAAKAAVDLVRRSLAGAPAPGLERLASGMSRS